MYRRSLFWMTAATLFTLGNAAGGGYAIAMGEALHASVHAALMVVGSGSIWWLLARSSRRDVPSLSQADDRLERLQQSMDAIALEVERIGESQRFTAKLQAEKLEQRR